MTHLETPVELQSNFDRQAWAEGLISQLPKTHDGRNSWLLNYGRGEEADKLREARGLPWSVEYQAVFPKHIHAAGTLVGKDIDTCAHCGADIRNNIHHGTTFTLPLPSPERQP